MKYLSSLCFLVVLFLPSLLFTACGAAGEGTGPVLLQSLSSTRSQTAFAQLVHAPTGMADLEWNLPQKTLSVSLQVSGLAAGTHPVLLKRGTCQRPSAALSLHQQLPPLVAGENGQATLKKTTITGISNQPTEALLLTIVNGPALSNVRTDPRNIDIACASITTKLQAVHGLLPERVLFGSTTAINEHARGTALLSLDTNGLLTVTIHLQDLAAGSRHAAHIHAGSCAAQGAMLHPFPTLVADTFGQVNTTVKFTGVHTIPISGWYVNIHFGEHLVDKHQHVIQEAFNPIACGDVVPAIKGTAPLHW